jgi:hypothetical protein
MGHQITFIKQQRGIRPHVRAPPEDGFDEIGTTKVSKETGP